MASNVYVGKVHITIDTPVVVELTEDNVMEWLDNCNDVKVLQRISAYSGALAKSMRSANHTTDDWRSRA